jgi:hypothetical protein
MVVVVVRWTRLRHQHWRRRICGVKHATHRPRAMDAARVRRQYTKKVCTADGGQRREVVPPVCPVGEGARVDMCRSAHALGSV